MRTAGASSRRPSSTRRRHYMRGGLPGKYPDFEGPLPNLYWGLGAGKKTPEQLAKRKADEERNERLAKRARN